MMPIEKGDYVIAVKPGGGRRASASGRYVSYAKGDELEVTSTRSAIYLNVRDGKYGAVFVIPRVDVTVETRRIGELPDGAISADDPRVAYIFEDAARMATRMGLCRDFDRLCDALGLPGRPREFSVTIADEPGFAVTAKVRARSRREARQLVIARAGSAGRAIEATA